MYMRSRSHVKTFQLSEFLPMILIDSDNRDPTEVYIYIHITMIRLTPVYDHIIIMIMIK